MTVENVCGQRNRPSDKKVHRTINKFQLITKKERQNRKKSRVKGDEFQESRRGSTLMA